MLDWGAIYSGAFAINVGKDMDMLGTVSFGSVFFNQNLTESVKNGSVLKDRLDDMCRRVMMLCFHLNQDKDFLVVDLSNKELNTVLFSSCKLQSLY